MSMPEQPRSALVTVVHDVYLSGLCPNQIPDKADVT